MSREARFEAVIGLEVHAQLRTRSKIFCGCPTAFGAPPNSQVCPVCLGHPGVLPVLNREAVFQAVRFGLAAGADIPGRNVFARKNYFYPDLPKGYQISQYARPVLSGGEIPFRVGGEERRVRLVRAHLEEDAGKSFHPESGREAVTRIDLNRSGIPLLEIVSEPDLTSPEEAHAYLERMRQLVIYLEICDGNMEEGSLRCDANISVRARGQKTLNPKTEIKNLNSFRNVARALSWEFHRQSGDLEEGQPPLQTTRLWDEAQGRTRIMRTKEEAHDYRYFPEPDLPALDLGVAEVERIRAAMPELPWEKERRFVDAYGLSREDAGLLAGSRELADYYEGVARGAGNGKAAANWVMTEVMHWIKESPEGCSGLKVAPDKLGKMVRMIEDGVISGTIGKRVFAEMVRTGGDPASIVAARGWQPIEDADALAGVVNEIVEGHPGPVADYLAGKEATFQFFLGQVMRRTQGRADPGMARNLLKDALQRERRRTSEEKPE